MKKVSAIFTKLIASVNLIKDRLFIILLMQFFNLKTSILSAFLLFTLSTISLLLLSSNLNSKTTVFAADTGIIGLGLISDSTTDEYRYDNNRGGAYGSSTFNWAEQLTSTKGVNLGPIGSFSEPRRSGYKYNWSRSGGRAKEIIAKGQHTGLAAQVSSGEVSHAIIALGNNDFAWYNGTYAEVYNGMTPADLQTKKDEIVFNIITAVDTLKAAGPVKIIVAKVIDPSTATQVMQNFPDPAKRQLITNTIDDINNRLSTDLASRNVPLFDLNAYVMTNVFPRINASRYINVDDELINFNGVGDEPHNLIIGDNIHTGTVGSGLIFGNAYIEALNTLTGATIAKFTDQEVLINSGIRQAPSPSPSILPSPVPSASPSPIPSPSPSVIPSPSPSVLPSPSPSIVPTPTATPVPSPTPAQVTVTFDDKSGQDQPLNGQYPTNFLNWGTSVWYHSAPWKLFTTKSASFNSSSRKSGTISVLNSKRLIKLDVFNGGTAASTVTLACSGQTSKSFSVAVNTKLTFSTGWTAACPTITVGSSNGWNTNFDNLIFQ